MASAVDICNLALGHLGDDANISEIVPPDGSAQAEHCARFYPIARDELVGSHAWSFATKRVALAQLSTTELPATWSYAYTLPSKCLNAIAVYLPVVANALVPVAQFANFPPIPNTPDDTNTQDFIVEALTDGTLVVFTNILGAQLRYIEQITDTTKFGPLVTTALARLLAAYLAGPIIKGTTGMAVAKEHMKIYREAELPLAKAADSRGRKQNVYNTFIPEGLRARQ